MTGVKASLLEIAVALSTTWIHLETDSRAPITSTSPVLEPHATATTPKEKWVCQPNAVFATVRNDKKDSSQTVEAS